MMIKTHYLLLISFCLLASTCQANPSSVKETRHQLNALQTKISQLERTLLSAHDKQKTLDHELAHTEKNISQSIRELHALHIKIQATMTKMNALKNQVAELNQRLIKERQALSEHLRTRYKINPYQPFKWLLNQDHPNTVHRLLTYHEYLLKQRQAVIQQVKQTKAELQLSETALSQEIQTHQALEKTIHQHQSALMQEKQYHKALMQKVQNDIQTKQHTMAEYKQNQASLSHILTALLQEQRTKPLHLPSFQINRKLATLVVQGKHDTQKINQGVIVFANEGAPVRAALPGKVVFNDWLKGYGLLLIIDHGHGLMTLYAYNQSLFKQKGDMVVKGEQIATVGHSGAMKENGLYFEVRRRGKAVSPLAWLS